MIFLGITCQDQENTGKKGEEIISGEGDSSIITINVDIPKIDTFYELKSDQILSSDTVWVGEDVPIKRVDQVLKAKDQYIVYGYANNGIYTVNSKSGEAKRIVEKGKGPQEIMSVADMVYDLNGNHLLVADQYLKKINRYGIDGEFLDIFHMDPPVRYLIGLENGIYLCSTNSRQANEEFIGSWKPGNPLKGIDFKEECTEAVKFSSYNKFSKYDGNVFVTKSMDKQCNFVYKWNQRDSLWSPGYKLMLRKFLDEDDENINMRLLRFIKISDEDVYLELLINRFLVKLLYHIPSKTGKAFRYFSIQNYALEHVGETIDNNLLLTSYKLKSTLSRDENMFYMQAPPPPGGGGVVYETDHPIILEVSWN
ncbi:6-bladed beta-propeller [Membranihabitans maritimus]|uniref:6-bladed beta-propeller n=1 Tax=Membranihabitans maritimus TaxID=2904244 RepID=UPI001F21B6A8